MSFLINIFPTNEVVLAKENEAVLESLKRNNLILKSSCGGHGTCGDCVIKIRTGNETLNPMTEAESKLLGNVFHITKERLACQIKCTSAIDIDISEQMLHIENAKILNQVKTIRKTKSEIELEKNAVSTAPREEKPPKQGGFKKPKQFK